LTKNRYELALPCEALLQSLRSVRMFCPILCTNYQTHSYQYSLTAKAQAAGF